MNVVFVVALFFRVVVVNEDDGCIERAFEFTIFASGVLAAAVKRLLLALLALAIFCSSVIPII